MNDNPVPGPGIGVGGLVGGQMSGEGIREGPRADESAYANEASTLVAPVKVELVVDPQRERAREGIANIDPFDISDLVKIYAPTRGDPAKGNVDREIDFNWKRWDTYGKQNYAELQEYHQQGWREVVHEMFPGRFAPPGTRGPVVVKDMVLMERPMRLTVKARNEEIEAATQAMRVNQRKLAVTLEGQAPRVVFANKSSQEAIPIPE